MDIGVPLKKLGEVDIADLKGAILNQEEEAWFEQEHRQNAYEVHRQTSSIVLLFCDNEWPNVSTFKEPGWERLADVMMPIIDDILKKYYPPGGTLLRAMAARLHVGGVIEPHVDKMASFHAGHRIHIPIQTNPRVRFTIEGRPYKLEVGQAYEINNQLTHSVMNKGNEDRIHVIFDYVPLKKS